jgi:beta-lactamase class A
MPDRALLQELEAIAAEHHGDVALFAENLATGESVAIRADEAVQTASVIKLAILYEAMQQIRDGEAHFDDALVMRKEDQVPRSGVLLFFDTPMRLTLKDALTMMIAMSDNTATNLVIDRLGRERINERIAKLGLKDTYLYRKVFRVVEGPVPEDNTRFGLGKTTPREMAGLMRKIVQGELAEAGEPARADDVKLCDAMLYMLRNQFYIGGVPRYLGKMYTDTESAIANKTGELDAVRNDVAAIETRVGTIILSIFTWNNLDQSWSVENEGELTIAKLSRAIVAAWSSDDL